MTAPKMFQTVPRQEAYENLFSRRQKENTNLEAKIAEILKEENTTQTYRDKESENIVIPAGKGQHNRIMDECRKSRSHVDFIMPWNGFLKWRRLLAKEESKECQKSNIKIRVVTGKIDESSAITHSEQIPSNPELTQIEVRYIQQEPLVNLALFDSRSIYIAIDPGKKVLDATLLRSNAQGMVEMGNSYFEKLWNIAKTGT